MNKPKYIQKECKHHGITQWHLEKRGSYRCQKCRSDRVAAHRRRLKEQCVELLGGKCQRCGYNKCAWGMHFHHKNPSEKLYNVASLVQNRKESLLFEELKKCELLCANCHAEEESMKWGLLAE